MSDNVAQLTRQLEIMALRSAAKTDQMVAMRKLLRERRTALRLAREEIRLLRERQTTLEREHAVYRAALLDALHTVTRGGAA